MVKTMASASQEAQGSSKKPRQRKGKEKDGEPILEDIEIEIRIKRIQEILTLMVLGMLPWTRTG